MAKQFKGIAKDFINAIKTQFIGQGADPNKIIVQDLFTYAPKNSSPINNTTLKSNALDELKVSSMEDRAILSTLLAVYNDKISDKRAILTQARNLFTTDIIQTVIDVMIDDGFNSFQNEKEEFKIEYVLDDDELQDLGEEFQEQIQELIDNFVSKFAIKSRIAEIVPELLRDGEYAFGVLFDEQNKKGITEIVDDFDVINLLPFYENDKLAFVINQNNINPEDNKVSYTMSNFTDDEKPVVYKPDNIVFFRLNGPTKLRIKMGQFYNSEFQKTFYNKTNIKLPKYVRTALPIFYAAIPLLNRLKIMENVSTVLDLSDVLKPEIVHVTVPTNTSSVEAEQIIRDYERHLNDMSGIVDAENFDLTTLAASANRRKVLPQWLDTKGQLSSASINQAAKGAAAWESIDKLRNLIALSIGIPPFYINISANPVGKAETIKLYSRYTRKLTSLQKTLADGIKDILQIHLQHCGININRDNLSVKFKALTSADALDDTDLLLGLVTAISEMYENLSKITSSEGNRLVLDDEQFKAFFDRCTSTYLNISNLIRIDEDKFEDIDGEDGGFEDDAGFTPSTSSHRERDRETSTPSVNVEVNTGSSEPSNDAYSDFVSASNDIGLPGTEPAIEEI